MAHRFCLHISTLPGSPKPTQDLPADHRRNHSGQNHRRLGRVAATNLAGKSPAEARQAADDLQTLRLGLEQIRAFLTLAWEMKFISHPPDGRTERPPRQPRPPKRPLAGVVREKMRVSIFTSDALADSQKAAAKGACRPAHKPAPEWTWGMPGS